ncbi:MAG: NADH-quinone oxidoreductase subunit D [Candidatus Krumholzibacteriia bacterium]
MATLRTQEMELNMGPHHPSTHGVIRFILKTDGEVISECKPDVGYLHRSIEKIGERCTYNGFMPYTDRVDYVAAMNANFAYALAVEKLAGIQCPRRGELLRILTAELGRISSHLIALGAMAMDIGAITPFPYALRERERVNDLLEEICGARLTFNYHRIGGVGWDMPEGWDKKVLSFCDSFESITEEFDRLITRNHIFIERLGGVVVIPAEDAIDFGLSGPNLRASGVDFDLRRDEPYSLYPELDFAVPVGTSEVGVVGDCYNRFVVRVEEMRESIKIARQCISKLPETDGENPVPKPKNFKVKPNECYVRSEAPRGEMGIYVVSDGSDKAWRYRARTGSFTAMGAVEHISPGIMIADLVAVIASFDVVAPEIDR